MVIEWYKEEGTGVYNIRGKPEGTNEKDDYPRVTGSEELGLHQESNMPMKGNPDWRQASRISQ